VRYRGRAMQSFGNWTCNPIAEVEVNLVARRSKHVLVQDSIHSYKLSEAMRLPLMAVSGKA